MVISNAGNLGVGTLYPTEKLTVAGTISGSDNLTLSHNKYFGSRDSSGTLSFYSSYDTYFGGYKLIGA